MFAGLKSAGRIAQGLCGVVSILLCGAPILVTVGVVLMMTVNTERDDNVNAYNTAVGEYDADPVNAFVPARINGITASVGTSSVTVAAGTSDDGVKAATSTYIRASSSSTFSIYSTIIFALTNVDTIYRSGIPSYKTGISTATCSTGNNNYCSSSTMGQYCRSQFGSSAQWQNTGYGRCSNGDDCGMCVYPLWLTDYCVVVTADTDPAASNPYQESAQYQSCYYPFSETDQRYDSLTRPTAITFTVRKDDDPFIAMQRITTGSEDFGSTDSAMHSNGLTFIGIGFGLLFLVSVLCCVIYCLVKSQEDHHHHHDHEPNQTGQTEMTGVHRTRGTEPIAGQPMAFSGEDSTTANVTINTEANFFTLGSSQTVIVIGQPLVCPYGAGDYSYTEELPQPVLPEFQHIGFHNDIPVEEEKRQRTSEVPQRERSAVAVIPGEPTEANNNTESQPASPHVGQDSHAFIS